MHWKLEHVAPPRVEVVCAGVGSAPPPQEAMGELDATRRMELACCKNMCFFLWLISRRTKDSVRQGNNKT